MYRRTWRQYKFIRLQYSTRIENQFNSKQIIQILLPKTIDFFDALVYS